MVSKLKVYSRISGITAFGIGSIVLSGWIFDIPVLKSLHPSLVSMKANTAIAMILAGVSIWLFHAPRKSTFNTFIVHCCTALVAAIGLLTLMEYIGGWNFGIDQIFFNEPPGTVGTYIPGRMALNTAFCFSCLGIALLLARSKAQVLFVASQFFSLASILVAITAVIGYFYSMNEFYGYMRFTQMALHTAFALVILGIGVLCAVPDRGIMMIISGNDFGGFLARRLLPVSIIIPILIGWLRLEGERHYFIGTAFGVLLVAVIYIILFIFLVWKVAQSLNRFDAERTEAVKALRESEEKFRAIFENNSSAIAIIDPDTTISMVNDAYCQVGGYTKEEVIGMSWTKQIPPDDLERLKEYNRRRILNPQDAPAKYEFNFYKKNGEIRHALISVSLIQSSQKIITSFTDITERKQAEEALRTSEEQFRLLLNSTAEAIYGIDLDGNCTFCNTACVQILGYKHPDELLGKNMHWQIHSKHADGTLFPIEECRVFKAFKKGEIAHVEDEVLWKADGTWFPAEYWSYPKLHDGKILGAVVTFLDITERKWAEDLLAAQKRRLTDILEGTNVGTWEWDIQTGETRYNDRWSEIIGYTLEELSPVSIDTRQKFIHPDDVRRSADLLEKHFRNELEYYECEVRFRHKNGNWVWVLDRGKVASWTKDGKPRMMSGTHQDITQRKIAEVERENLIKELQSALDNVKTLQGLIPICANCKKIRDDTGYWQQVEGYIQKHTEIKFSHGICPECAIILYPDFIKNKR